MAIKESALALITSVTQSDLVRAVTAAGASRRITVANLAKAIVEDYTGSSLAGTAQSVKSAIYALNRRATINFTDISVAGTAVTSSDSGWYYAEVPLSGLPENTRVISVCPIGSWDASVFYRLYGSNQILITSPTSRTLGAGRSIRVFYQYLL